MAHTTKQPGKIFYGYFIVFALILAIGIPLSCGINAAGIFYTSLAKEFSTSSGTLSYYTSFLWGAGLISLPFMGRLLDKVDARICVAGSCLLITLDFIWLAFMHELWQYFVGAFIMGFGVTMLNLMAPATIINRWFAKNAGLYVGIVMAFTGIGGLVFSTVGGSLILSIGWSNTYLVFALLSAITVPITWFIIKSYPEDMGLKPYGIEDLAKAQGGDADAALKQAEQGGLTAKQAYKTKAFFLILTLCFIMNFCMYTYYIIPSYVDQLSIGMMIPLLGAVASSVAMGAQTATKFGMGALSSRFPYKGTLVCFIFGACGIATLGFGGSSMVLILAGALGYGLFHGTVNVMLPVFTETAFGNREYAKVYSRISMGACAGNIVTGLVWGTVIHYTDNYTLVFTCLALLLVVAMVLLTFLHNGFKKEGKTPKQMRAQAEHSTPTE